MTTSEGGLSDGHLPLVAVAYDIICLRGLGNLSEVLVGIPLIHLAHVAWLMLGSGIVIKWHESSVGIGIICHKYRTVLTGVLANDKVSTCAYR